MATGGKRTMFFFKKEILKRNNWPSKPDKHCFRYSNDDGTGNDGRIKYRDENSMLQTINNITTQSGTVQVFAVGILEQYNVVPTTCT